MLIATQLSFCVRCTAFAVDFDASLWIVPILWVLCSCGFHCVISGLLAGSPGFRSVLCCFDCSPSSVWRFLWFQSLRWYKVITLLSVTDVANWAAVHFALFVLFGFCLGCFGVVLFILVCCSCFFCLFFPPASWRLIGLCTGPVSVWILFPPSVKMDNVTDLIK